MKKVASKSKAVSAILLLFLLGLVVCQAQTSQQQQLATDIEIKTSGESGNTINNCQSVTFIFRASYTGNIQGRAFTSADVPLTIRAENGSVLRSVAYTVTGGTLAIVEVHN